MTMIQNIDSFLLPLSDESLFQKPANEEQDGNEQGYIAHKRTLQSLQHLYVRRRDYQKMNVVMENEKKDRKYRVSLTRKFKVKY